VNDPSTREASVLGGTKDKSPNNPKCIEVTTTMKLNMTSSLLNS